MTRLVILQTSPRIPAGVLSRAAWQALEQADLVLAADVTAPVCVALTAQGVDVVAQRDPTAQGLLGTAAGRDVVWLLDPVGEEELLRGLADEAVRRTDPSGRSAPAETAPPEIEILVGSFDPVGGRLLDLVEVMDRLRRECPWDQRQTHESLVHYLLEETYE